MCGVARVEEAEHPDGAGEHVCGALSIASKLNVQGIHAKRHECLLDHPDPFANTLVLALPDRAQRVHCPGGVLQLGLGCWPHTGGCRAGTHGDHLGQVAGSIKLDIGSQSEHWDEGYPQARHGKLPTTRLWRLSLTPQDD